MLARRVAAVVAVAAGAAVLAGSTSGAAAATAYVSIPALVAGHGYEGSVLGSARAGQPVTVHVEFGSPPEGATSNEVVVGRPGVSADAGAGTHAAADEANQMPVTQQLAATSLSVRVTPRSAGTYPVFVLSSGDLGCASPSMDDETINFTVTQVGVLRVS